MIRRYKLSRFLSEAFKGIYRNPLSSVVSFISVMLALLVMGTFWMLKENIDYNLSAMGDYHKIIVYMELDATDEELQSARAQLRDIVAVDDSAIEFTSKEDALELEKQKWGEEYAYIFDSYRDGANPLPDSFTVSYPEQTGDIDYIMQRITGISKVESVKNRQEIADKITNLKNIVNHVSTALLIMLFVVSVFVIGNTVKLTHEARKEEIKIMRYIGATNFYIEMPFVLEGVIIGIVSAVAAFTLQIYAYNLVCANIKANYGSFVQLLDISATPAYINVSYSVILIAMFVIVGLLTGILGVFTTQKYLKA